VVALVVSFIAPFVVDRCLSAHLESSASELRTAEALGHLVRASRASSRLGVGTPILPGPNRRRLPLSSGPGPYGVNLVDVKAAPAPQLRIRIRRVIAELVATEVRYVETLQTFMDMYLRPLEDEIQLKTKTKRSTTKTARKKKKEEANDPFERAGRIRWPFRAAEAVWHVHSQVILPRLQAILAALNTGEAEDQDPGEAGKAGKAGSKAGEVGDECSGLGDWCGRADGSGKGEVERKIGTPRADRVMDQADSEDKDKDDKEGSEGNAASENNESKEGKEGNEEAHEEAALEEGNERNERNEEALSSSPDPLLAALEDVSRMFVDSAPLMSLAYSTLVQWFATTENLGMELRNNPHMFSSSSSSSSGSSSDSYRRHAGLALFFQSDNRRPCIEAEQCFVRADAASAQSSTSAFGGSFDAMRATIFSRLPRYMLLLRDLQRSYQRVRNLELDASFPPPPSGRSVR
jgi:hypothetical protein